MNSALCTKLPETSHWGHRGGFSAPSIWLLVTGQESHDLFLNAIADKVNGVSCSLACPPAGEWQRGEPLVCHRLAGDDPPVSR